MLTTKTYAAHLANREFFKIIETNEYTPLSQFDYIILPQSNNFESIGGKLIQIKGSESEKKINVIIKEAENTERKNNVNGFKNIEIELNKTWWRKQNWKIIISPGLFTHVRLSDRGY